MTLAALAFTIMIATVKVARAEMSPFEIIVFRSVVSIPIVVVWCFRTGHFRLHNRRVFALRTGAGFVAMVGYFTATKGLPIADLSLITKVQPILIAIAAPILMGAKERVGPTVWVALLLGLVGCAILISPDLETGATYGLIALGSTVLSAVAHLGVRALSETDTAPVIVLWFQGALLPLAFLGHMVFFGEVPGLPPPHLVGWVLLCGLMATAGQLLMTNAYRHDRAAIVAAASYTAPLWAVMIDVALFALVPSIHVWIGGAFVVIAGLLVLRSR